MKDIIIRPATRTDAEQVAAVYLASRKAFLGFAPLVHTDNEVRHWIRDHLIPSGGVSVAVPGDPPASPVGMMALSYAGAIGWIDQLYLHPSVTGGGIGARFVARAKAELGSPIRLYTFQDNERARRFYESHGFRALEFHDGSENEEGCPDVLYEWA